MMRSREKGDGGRKWGGIRPIYNSEMEQNSKVPKKSWWTLKSLNSYKFMNEPSTTSHAHSCEAYLNTFVHIYR